MTTGVSIGICKNPNAPAWACFIPFPWHKFRAESHRLNFCLPAVFPARRVFDPIISMFISSVICSIHIFKDLHGVLPQALWLWNFICYGCLTMPPLWGFFFYFFSNNCLLKLLNNASPFSGRHPVTNCFGANILWLVKSSLDFSRTGNSDSELRLHRNHREFFCPSGASQFHWLSPRGHYESVACIVVKKSILWSLTEPVNNKQREYEDEAWL